MDAGLILQAAVLGLVQGLTEFLPVSSTGHLILAPALLGWTGSLLNRLEFDVALHVGTLVSLLAVFWRDWWVLARAALQSLSVRSLADPQARLAWLLALATLPGVVAGLLFERQVETTLRSPYVVGAMMVLVGLLLAVIDRRAGQGKSELSLGPVGALAIGVGQAVALVPGVSRSGSTIGVGLAAGLSRSAAARFSFLLSTPIVMGAVANQSLDVAVGGLSPGELAALGAGIAAAGVSGYACIRFLLAYLRTRTLMPFVIYRVIVGSLVLLLAAAGRLEVPAAV